MPTYTSGNSRDAEYTSMLRSCESIVARLAR